MREHFKTALLVALIFTSFAQTGMLWYSSPSYEETRDGYIKPPQIGSEKFKKDVFELAAPQQILLHQKGTHREIFPDHPTYRDLLRHLHQHAELDDPEEIRPSPDDWEKLYERTPGLELRFAHDLPAGVIRVLFNDAPVPDLQTISRIWIISEEHPNAFSIRFISDREQKVAQSPAEIDGFDEWLNFAATPGGVRVEPVFSTGRSKIDEDDKDSQRIPHPFYLPENGMTVNRYTYKMNKILIEDMLAALFPDPELAQRTPLVLEKSKVYTDSSRNLQHNIQSESMVYYNDPLPRSSEPSTLAEEMEAMNQFINRHSGWTGNYLLDRVEEDSNTEQRYYIFRLILRNHPVYWPSRDERESGPDTIRLSTSGKGVSTYERSLFYLLPDPEGTKRDRLPGRKEVLSALKQKGIPLTEIQQLHPGYRAKVRDGFADLVPVWVVVQRDGQQTFIPAP